MESQTSQLSGPALTFEAPDGELPEPTKVVGSAVSRRAPDRVLLLARATALGKKAEAISAERGELRDERIRISSQGHQLRERRNALLAECAVVVALACTAGLDRDTSWCRALAAELDARWTGLSDKNPRAALIRVVARGQVTPDTARTAARAIDALLDRSSDDLMAMPLDEREARIAEVFSRGVHHLLQAGARAFGNSTLKRSAAGRVLQGPGLDLLQSGQPRRAVIELQEDGTVTLILLAAPDMRAVLQPGPTWDDRKWSEVKNAARGAGWIGVGEEARIHAAALPGLLRLAEDGCITAECYLPDREKGS